jgi:hypothetical protein
MYFLQFSDWRIRAQSNTIGLRSTPKESVMKNLRQAVVRVGIVGAITVTQIGAAPQKEPYVTSWYLHAQRLVNIFGGIADAHHPVVCFIPLFWQR